MTITLNLAPETERKIHEHAAASGQTVEGFIRGLLEEAIEDEGIHSAAPSQRSKPLDETLEPVRREFEESGMTEEELVQFLMGVRDQVRQDKRTRNVK
jgi:hypothetical protein